MWAQYKEPHPFEGDRTRKVWGKETLLWCFIYQRNHFPRLKTHSVLPVGLEQAAGFLSWNLVARLNNAGRGRRRCHVLKTRRFLSDRRFRLNRVFTVLVTSEWTDTIVPFRFVENAGTIDGSFWTLTWNKRHRWKCFLLGLESPQNFPGCFSWWDFGFFYLSLSF